MIRVGTAIVLLTIVAALLGPIVTPYDPSAQELSRRLESPSLSHPFGLDELGRDILSRLLSGARISLLVGLAVGIAISLLQALTQIQEMTIAFVPKILAIFLSLLIALPFMAEKLHAEMLRIAARIVSG